MTAPINQERETVRRWLQGEASDFELDEAIRRHVEQMLASMHPSTCCCSWGAARGGHGTRGDAEWPEFGCYRCPIHQHAMGEQPDELCKRHRRERRAEQDREEGAAWGSI
jgi:hypothetical protein